MIVGQCRTRLRLTWLRGDHRVITVPALAADALGNFIADYMQKRYGSTEPHLCDVVPSIARIALECIGNSDALYHNVEHTMLVTLACLTLSEDAMSTTRA